MKTLTITVDGPAGAGKSTIAKILADSLKSTYIDTGAMYRSVTCAALLYQIDVNNEPELTKLAKDIKAEYKDSKLEYYINGLYLSPFVRSIAVSSNVSEVSIHAGVRRAMVELQRRIANESPFGAVMEGRDTGSTVLPGADLKIFLTASLEERVNRRHEQYLRKNIHINRIDVKAEIEKRDRIDSERKVSPLSVPSGAILIDSTELNIEEVIDKILMFVKQRD